MLTKLRSAIFGKSDDEPRLALLKRLPRSAIVAEIGVWKGDFSSRILEVTSPLELHLIDPWAFQPAFPDRMYGGKVAAGQSDMDEIYRTVAEKFQANDNVKIHRAFSQDALRTFDDGYFDWVYIDGNHYYEYVLHDLELAYNKVRVGGVISGDDYRWRAKNDFPVARAVKDFIKAKKLENNLQILQSQFMIKL